MPTPGFIISVHWEYFNGREVSPSIYIAGDLPSDRCVEEVYKAIDQFRKEKTIEEWANSDACSRLADS